MCDIDIAVSAVIDDIRNIRHRLHRIPELAGEEKETAELIRRELSAIPGIQLLPPVCNTGTAALLCGAHPGRTAGLRADIDALPMAEKSQLPYASVHPGIMHACGHDGHAAMLIGAAKVLSMMQNQLHGTVKFIFQPGEEVKAMAGDMIAAGVLENPHVDIITALHNWPGIKAGNIAVKAGAVMSSAAHFYITLRGRSGHGSAPDKAVDPVTAGAALIQSLQTIVSRNMPPAETAVVSICRVTTDTLSSNIIPESMQIDGTVRTLTPETAALTEKRLREIVSGISGAYGVAADVVYNADYPVTCNTPEAAALAEKTVIKYFGREHLEKPEKSAMTAEDFACYLERIPGVFVHLGAGEEHPPLHSSGFDFNDDILRDGIKYLAAFAMEAGKA